MKTLKTMFCSLVLLAAAASSGRAATTVVTLSFDDTIDDQAQVGDLLAARGMHATFFVNSPRIGQPGYMTMDQLMALQAAGNEIAGHTVNHIILNDVPDDEKMRQICNDRAQLLNMGFQVANFAYPHGAADLSNHDMVTMCGYNAGRSSSSLRSHDPETCTNCAYAETMPPVDPLAIRTPVSVKSNITLADLQLNVTDAETHGGGWIPFVFHHVCDGCNTLAISPTTLTQFLDWLATRSANGTTVKSVQEVIGGSVSPAVMGPAPTPYAAADGNLLQNASLETDTNGDGVPDCWTVGSGGSDSATFMSGAAPSAHSGSFAEQVGVIAGQTSSPRILSGQDLGACAPSGTPGHKYHMKTYYQATDGAILVAYYRNSLGWWKYWAKSAPLAAATDWTLAEWTTPNLPMEATAISVGIAVASTGTVMADDFYLVDTAGPQVTPGDGGADVPDGGVPTDDGGTVTNTPVDSSATATSSNGCAMAPGPHGGALALAALAAFMLIVLRRRQTR